MDTLATNFADIGAAHYLATAGLITAATPGSPEHVEAMTLGPFLLRRTCFGRGSASTITGYALHAYRRALTAVVAEVASTLTIEEV